MTGGSLPTVKIQDSVIATLSLDAVATNFSEDRVTIRVEIGAATSVFPSVCVNEQSGDDAHGDGSRERPFRTRARAAQSLGIPIEILSPRPRKLPDPPPKIGPTNRHERRAAKARDR